MRLGRRSATRVWVATVVLLLGVVVPCSCDRQTDRKETRLAAMNDDVKVELVVRVWGETAQPGLAGRLYIKNISTQPISVYEDPKLPTMLHDPPDGVDIGFCLSRYPKFVNVDPPESLGVRVLMPGESYCYPVVVPNPLREQSCYGNPAYDWPDSPLRDQRPGRMRWHNWRARVGYLPFDFVRVTGQSWACEGIMVKQGGGKSPLIDYQRQIEVAGSVGEHEMVSPGLTH